MTDMKQVEKLSRRRRGLMLVFVGSFLTWQVPFMDRYEAVAAGAIRNVDLVYIAGFLLWALVLIALLRFGRSGAKSPEVRAALEDELTQDNRAKAFSFGYWAMLIIAGVAFAASFFVGMSAQEVAHLIIVAAVVAPLLRFAFLERG
ncbi:hypothetical protein [Maricaulis sp.]|uniref:hypothetical protein n=1 Tax=Maricaulis sp. TaxID=1486257 RepID=UPI00262EAB91|nr:hypothetical protein [Maricaulis sp.]